MDRIIKKKAGEASATRCASEIVQEALVRHALRRKFALNCVNAAIADFRLLRNDMERRLDAIESNLSGRKSIVEAFIRNALPPRNVTDPLQRMENAEDVDHQE
ncbi:hypothetical protein PC115_g8211 [Phytophthora cactorum]|uniref:Uncharacterized protein n=1 Tax=Phytophthora cactorum TaxID=29920 RepID=A0A8T1CL39_9STRA|nr:hypothetical protein PC115_g8211 [Phytophthora cactorum]